MEQIDRKLQAKVWQRVQNSQESPALPRLSLLEAETAALLRALSVHYSANPALKQMLAETGKHIACLQGIQSLKLGTKKPQPPLKPALKDPVALVQKCYVNCLNLGNAYESLRSDPEYGIVYAELAQAKRRHCTELLAVLGK